LCAQCLLALLAKEHRALPQAPVLQVKRQKTRPQQQRRSRGSQVKETENNKKAKSKHFSQKSQLQQNLTVLDI